MDRLDIVFFSYCFLMSCVPGFHGSMEKLEDTAMNSLRQILALQGKQCQVRKG